MRRLRFRLTIRRLALLIVLVALGLVGWRVYREGPETHWLLLKLRYGDVETRRAAAQTIRKGAGVVGLQEWIREDLVPKDPRERQNYLSLRQQRLDMVFPAVLHAANDPDPECRATALGVAAWLAVYQSSDLLKGQVLKKTLVALRDPEERVRASALGTLAGIAQQSTALEAFKTALSDPSIHVQERAIRELGMLGVIARETQSEVASILAEVLASQRDDSVRIWAAWGLGFLGSDRRRQPGTGPDVVPALIGALRDPEVRVRRKAASILSRSTIYNRLQQVSEWNLRKDAIIPPCRKALTDADEEVCDHAALALFWLGVRDADIIARLEAQCRRPDPNLARNEFRDALDAWKAESEPTMPADPALGEPN
jgi:hypothetical protein